MSAETFEQIVVASQTSGDYNPTWKRFAKTRFFVPLARAGAELQGQPGQHFKLARHPQSGKSIVTIAEDRQLLEERGENAAHLHGAEILKLLSPEIGILVALTDRSFGIPAGLVGRLKQSLEAAAAAKAQAAQAPAPAPNGGLPRIDAGLADLRQPAGPRIVQREAPRAEVAPAVAPSSPALTLESVAVTAAAKKTVPKSSGGYLDVAALRPRPVAIEHLGLNFFIPGAWKETKSGKSLEFSDAEGQLRLEAGGTVRAGRTVDQWLAMRMQTLAHDMPYLKQVGEAYPVEGEDWGDRVVARVVELRGTPPGASEQRSVLLCCLRTESVLASIAISADVDVFEQSRPLFKWLLPRANLIAREEDQIEQGNTIDEGLPSHASLVASGHRMTIVSILSNAALLSQAQNLHIFVVIYLMLCIAGFGCFGLYRITQGLRFPLWAKVLFFGGMFVPVVSLVMILLVRWRARSFLREAGYRIGFLGAHDAIDDSNHDLRNTMILALLLALPLYGLVHVAEKRLGLERKMAVFAAPDHSFSALMPDSPTTRSGAPAGSDEQVWTAKSGGIEYNAGYTWITAGDDDAEKTLRDFSKNRSRAMNWAMDSSLPDEVDAHEALRVEATAANGDSVSAEYVLVEHRLFMFWVEFPAKDKDSLKAEEFLDSVSLRQGGGRQPN
jgi:hypothetical protein